jgi:hypothetical protein
MELEIKKILDSKLQGFDYGIDTYKDGTIRIWAACSDYLINQCRDQKPQMVSLGIFRDMELKPFSFGGMGGGRIYLIPNKDDPKESWLAMVGYKIKFRTPKPNKEKVLEAIGKFFDNYKQALIDNIDRLKYKEYVDYNKLLNL